MEVHKEQVRNETDLAYVSKSLPDMPPVEPLNPRESDAFFASELNKLSMEERDEVLLDLHGVSDVMDENPELVATSIIRLLCQLDNIPNEEKRAYLQALQQNEQYVRDEKFLLMFLRADRFNIPAAASRVVAFYETKSDLFGRDKLGRDILISDLTADDVACLESGYAQILSGRDRAGRAILCIMPMIRNYKIIENKVSVIRDCCDTLVY
jgi:hypothetical protein